MSESSKPVEVISDPVAWVVGGRAEVRDDEWGRCPR
jgi:hypothetical protein